MNLLIVNDTGLVGGGAELIRAGRGPLEPFGLTELPVD